MKSKTRRPLVSLLAALVLFSASLAAIPGIALAAPGDTGTTGNWNWTELPDGTLKIGYPTLPLTGSCTLPDTLSGKTVTQIADSAFQGSTGLTAFSLPSTLKTIGVHAFLGCTALSSITIPDSVVTINEGAFDECINLQTVTLPDNLHSHLQSIGQIAFEGCTALESIAIPNTVTNIDPAVFANCTSLSAATLPANPAFTAISTSMFNGCTDLHSIVIPAPVTSIGVQAFAGTGISTVDLHGITSIGEEAFMGSGLTTVAIPADTTSIGMMAFAACPDLTGITVDPANTHYRSDGGLLYNIGKTTLMAFPGAKTGVFQVPSGVSDIAEGAFFGCQHLAGITLTDDVQTIGETAFAYSGLTSVTIPKGVTSVGTGAFLQCADLTKAVFLCPGATLGSSVFLMSGISGDGIYGFAGSTAQSYATTNNIPFHILYTVTFQSSGGSAVGDIYVETGHTFSAPADPAMSGYDFSGWYRDSDFTEPWDFSTDTVTADMTLYPKWTPVPTATPSATPSASPTATPEPTATPLLQITMSPANGKIYTGGRITLTPSIAGGAWSFDGTLLSRQGDTFTGLKKGTARVTYTVNAQTAYVDVIIAQAEMPQTGQDFSAALWLLAGAAATGAAALALLLMKRRPRRA